MPTVDELRVRRGLKALEAIKNIGEDVLGESVRRAPIKEGTLRGSAELGFRINGTTLLEGEGAYGQAVELVTGLAARGELRLIEAVVSFNTIYALRQHEELEWDHPLDGQAKYLESVIQERAARYLHILDLAMRTA